METTYKSSVPLVKPTNQVTKGWQIDLIFTQLFVSFLAAIGAVILFLVVDGYLAHFELFNEVAYAICSAYGGMLIGISVVGFWYLKQIDCKQYFFRFVIQSIVGLAVLPLVVYTLLKVFHLDVSNILVSLIAVFLPLIGAVLGFNLFLIRTLKKKSDVTKSLVAV